MEQGAVGYERDKERRMSAKFRNFFSFVITAYSLATTITIQGSLQ